MRNWCYNQTAGGNSIGEVTKVSNHTYSYSVTVYQRHLHNVSFLQVIRLLEYQNVGGLVFILHITNTNLVTAGLQRHIVYTDKVHQLNNKQSGHVSILIQYKMVKPSLVTVHLCGLQQRKEDHMAVTPSLSRSINVSLTQLFFCCDSQSPT